MPRVPHEPVNPGPFTDERFQVAMNDLVRGIRQDLSARELHRHVASSARTAVLLAIVIVAATLTLTLMRRNTNGPTMSSADASIERVESKQVPALQEPRVPRIEMFEEEDDAESVAGAAIRSRVLKRLRVIENLEAPTGWIVPSNSELQSLQRSLQETAHHDKAEVIAERLRHSINNPHSLRTALLLASPTLMGNEVRAAVQVLRALPGDNWERALEGAVPKANEPFRSAWLSLLGAGAGPDALDWLLPLLTSPQDVVDRDVVLCVASILERHPYRADPEMALFLAKPVPQQLAALEVVRKLPGHVSSELIVGFLHSTESAVRACALKIYSELPQPSALPEMARTLLTDFDQSVRLNALCAASRAKDLASIPIILGLPESKDANESTARHQALMDISGIKLPNDIPQWMAWWALDGQLIARALEEALVRLNSGDVSEQTAATRELVPLNHFLVQSQRDYIRQQIYVGPAELRRASAYFLLATQTTLTPSESQLARELLQP